MRSQIYAYTRPLLYENHFKFDDTATLAYFLTTKSTEVKRMMTSCVEIVAYKKPTGVIAMQGLADCTNLRKVHIGTGVNTNATPARAAKIFFNDAGHFLRAMKDVHGSVDKAVGILRFGRTEKCFGIKDGIQTRGWSDEEKSEFIATLKDLLK
ncbi:hypothetical protein K461DRAFT_279356 [Myriangium duriaei CBS 260.36]|uniref:Uncharacterized protein n=1 Tax=Myriangium duriaei CBS 260.36 TaxID=1168546 RepID=A0A9P4J222_9PEZI|nr:hypothetical protein K461DRAFT_279356 [Myriangium duriaei CBS 260.36]